MNISLKGHESYEPVPSICRVDAALAFSEESFSSVFFAVKKRSEFFQDNRPTLFCWAKELPFLRSDKDQEPKKNRPGSGGDKV